MMQRIHDSLPRSFRSGLVVAVLCFAVTGVSSARLYGQQTAKPQPANQVEAIKQDVKQLQELVREIEGRLFILQQKLAKLDPPKTSGEIKQRAELLSRIFASLNNLRNVGRLQQIKINVTVGKEGQVLLKGNVKDSAQMKEILEAVRKVSGVKKIINEIKIGLPMDKNALRNPSQTFWPVGREAIDEGMLIDALEHSRRFAR